VSERTIVNVVQLGGYRWVWGRLTDALHKHLDAQVLVSSGQIVEADKYISMCPEYMAAIDPANHKDTVCLVHHFEQAYNRTIDKRMCYIKQAGSVVTMNGEVARLLNSRGIECDIIGYGIDPTLWTPTIQSHNPVIGVCGRNYDTGRKNPNGIVEVAKRVAQKAPNGAKFLFCGREWTGVVNQINDIDGISASNFEHQDDYSKYDQFYREISTLLSCSWVEGGPYPALEALASGRKVVSTPVGFMPELQSECGDYVRLFEQGNFNKAADDVLEPASDPFMCARSIHHRYWRTECDKWSKILGLGQKCQSLALNEKKSWNKLCTKLETEIFS